MSKRHVFSVSFDLKLAYDFGSCCLCLQTNIDRNKFQEKKSHRSSSRLGSIALNNIEWERKTKTVAWNYGKKKVKVICKTAVSSVHFRVALSLFLTEISLLLRSRTKAPALVLNAFDVLLMFTVEIIVCVYCYYVHLYNINPITLGNLWSLSAGVRSFFLIFYFLNFRCFERADLDQTAKWIHFLLLVKPLFLHWIHSSWYVHCTIQY